MLAKKMFATILAYGLSTVVCQAQENKKPCTVTPEHVSSIKVAHQLMKTTPRSERDKLALGDVVFVLLCGSPDDAAELFESLKGKPVLLDTRVLAANEHVVNACWDTGDATTSKAFFFHFESPLQFPPAVGARIAITGIYSSYQRELFRINVVGSGMKPLTYPFTEFVQCQVAPTR